MIWMLAASAFGFQPPNSWIGPSVGTPWTIGGRGEAWFADELSGEVGAGTGTDTDPVGIDLALRWRPDVLCFSCDTRAMVTAGVGVGALVLPELDLVGPWQWAVGPDLAATFVYWFSTGYGVAVSARGGVGPTFEGDDVGGPLEPTPWLFGTVGLAF